MGAEFFSQPCYYCGLPAATGDHVPPLCYAETLLELGKCQPHDLVLIPACSWCNGSLSKSIEVSPSKRRAIIKQKLSKRCGHRVRWDEDEISELGPLMQREVRAWQAETQLYVWRHAWRCPLLDEPE